MPNHSFKTLWISYLIATIGTIGSLLLFLFFWNNIHTYLPLLMNTPQLLPWLILLLGICFSLLLSMMIGFLQVANQRAISLNKMNDNFNKEVEERINTEEAKQKLEIALLQGQKLQAIGTLAGGVAHDFNNILYAIIGYVEIAKEDLKQNNLIYNNLEKVLSGAHRGQELISRLLSFSRRQHRIFEVIDLKETIESVLALLRPTIPASVNLRIKSDIKPYISGNQTQLHQVLVNLINNSVDAMDGEGSITITLSPLAVEEAMKHFPSHKNSPYCQISISDTGHGMDQETMKRIFEPFYTTKEVGKGTGLGLSIVDSIITEHQGKILVSSQLGKGTTFNILLPEYIQAD